MKNTLLLICMCFLPVMLIAQVGIGTNSPDASTVLDVASTERGVRMPGMTSTQRREIVNPVVGLLVFDTDTESYWVYRNSGWTDLGTDVFPESGLHLIYCEPNDVVTAEYTTMLPTGALQTSAWQTFTAGHTGMLTHYLVQGAIFMGTDVKIYEGAGTGGTLLYSTIWNPGAGGPWYNLPIPDSTIFVEEGQQYTVRLANSPFVGWQYGPESYSDPSSISPTGYYIFQAVVDSCVETNLDFLSVNSDLSSFNLHAVDTLWFQDATYITTAPDTDTDDQTVDTLQLNGTVLEISLEDDGQAAQTVNLASINTDDQTIDHLSLNETNLEISLENDGQPFQTVNLSSIDTDDQQIDQLSLNGTNLEISLQNDGQPAQSVDLNSLSLPVGTVVMWPKSTPPDGWLICDGIAVPNMNVDYPALFALLGTNVVPNFNGRFPVGVGNSATTGSSLLSLGGTGGTAKHQLLQAEMPAHTHNVNIPFRLGEENGTGNTYTDIDDPSPTDSNDYTTTSAGGNSAHENMPPYFVINFIIKAE